MAKNMDLLLHFFTLIRKIIYDNFSLETILKRFKIKRAFTFKILFVYFKIRYFATFN